MAGRSLVARIEGLPSGSWGLRIKASVAGLEILPEDENSDAPTDASISGTPMELQRLMFSDRDAPIRSGRVSFSGDIEVAERFRALIETARPDFEERLAAWVGEPAAFAMSNWVRDLRDWVLDSTDEAMYRTSEFLQEDARHLPTFAEMNEFCAEVDELANDAERLDARIRRLATLAGAAK